MYISPLKVDSKNKVVNVGKYSSLLPSPSSLLFGTFQIPHSHFCCILRLPGNTVVVYLQSPTTELIIMIIIIIIMLIIIILIIKP